MNKKIKIFSLVIISILFSRVTAQQEADITAINSILDGFHNAAATADWETYFNLMSVDGIFLGTDADERWTKSEFQAYASNRQGWVYTTQVRHINLTPDGNSAWFDEILLSESYGTSRGTGVLIRTNDGWRISQYHLTFPIPNALAPRITDEIKRYEAQQ